jgi:hypothetical protein
MQTRYASASDFIANNDVRGNQIYINLQRLGVVNVDATEDQRKDARAILVMMTFCKKDKPLEFIIDQFGSVKSHAKIVKHIKYLCSEDQKILDSNTPPKLSFRRIRRSLKRLDNALYILNKPSRGSDDGIESIFSDYIPKISRISSDWLLAKATAVRLYTKTNVTRQFRLEMKKAYPKIFTSKFIIDSEGGIRSKLTSLGVVIIEYNLKEQEYKNSRYLPLDNIFLSKKHTLPDYSKFEYNGTKLT